MVFAVKKKLEAEEYEKVIHFLNSLEYYCIEQHPDWNIKIEKYSHNYFVGTDKEGLVKCFGNIVLSNGPFKKANIKFGPAFSDFTILTEAIQFLHSYFSAKKFISFSIQLGIYINNQTELLEYIINKDFKIKYFFKPGNLWASVCVDLKRSDKEILRSFSRGHRNTIMTSYSNKNLRIITENNLRYLQLFINLYIKMMQARNLRFDKEDLIHLFSNVNNFLYENNKGFIEYIFHEDTLVGGAIIIYQGNTARYYKGAADPERRDIPVLHLGLFGAMKLCKENSIVKFDLWGYNHFVDENDQVFNINKFKKGFGGDFAFFPKQMNFILKPFLFKFYNFLKGCKKIIKQLKITR